jgi:hypothetical protein
MLICQMYSATFVEGIRSQEMDLQGRVCLVTGGSSGIGAATAPSLVQDLTTFRVKRSAIAIISENPDVFWLEGLLLGI